MPDPTSVVSVARTLTKQLTRAVVDQAAVLLHDLVHRGAALGWVDPPDRPEVAALLEGVAAGVEDGDAALVLAWSGAHLGGLGYWRGATPDPPTARTPTSKESLSTPASKAAAWAVP